MAGDLALAHGHRLLRLLGATWQVRHAGIENMERARAFRGPVIYVFTHGVILPLVYTHRDRGVQVLISESRDGQIMTGIAEGMGLCAVRGSSTRGGGRAVVELARYARRGQDLAITPDGPKGPRGSAAPGTVLVAARGEIPIVPLGVAAEPAWRAKSWDRFLVPHVGARVAVANGPPLFFGREHVGDPESVKAIERAMHDVEQRAEELLRTRFQGVATRKTAL